MSLFESLIIYIDTFLLSLCFYWKATRDRKGNVVFRLLALLVPSVMAAFRTSGADYKTYIEYFNTIKEIGFGINREPLWVLLNILSPDKYVMLFAVSMLFLVFSDFAIQEQLKEHKDIAWMIVLLVFYSTFMNIMRQMIATAIIMWAYGGLKNKNQILAYVRYYAGVLAAFLFHTSALLMAVLPLVIWVARKIKEYDKFILLAAIILPAYMPLIVEILSIFNLYEKYIGELIVDIDPSFIICMLPPVVVYYMTGGRDTHSEKTNDLFHLYMISFVAQAIGFRAMYVDRLTYFFYFYLLLFVPMLLQEITPKRMWKMRPQMLNDGKTLQVQSLFRDLFTLWFVVYYFAVFYVVGTATVFPYR